MGIDLPPSRGFIATLLPATMAALLYAAAAWIALALAVMPGFAASIFPAAGIALAASLVYGWRVLPGVALAAFLVSALLSGPRPASNLLIPWLVAAVNGLAAAAQAALGARLLLGPGALREGRDWPLREPRDIVAFCLLGALLPCTLSATLTLATMMLGGVMPTATAPTAWWTWWLGDALGVIVAAPIALSLIGRPRADWAPRRLSVGLPLLAALILLAEATIQVAQWDRQRRQDLFSRDAQAATLAVLDQLRESRAALAAMQAYLAAPGPQDEAALQRAAAPWLSRWVGLQAVGIAEADASMAPTGAVQAAAGDGRAILVRQVVRQTVPEAGDAVRPGLDLHAVAAAREALAQALQSTDAHATPPLRLL